MMSIGEETGFRSGAPDVLTVLGGEQGLAERAQELVGRLFAGHERQGGEPMVDHLLGVYDLIRQLTDDEDVRTAALLHDVLEDISPDIYSAEQLEADYGSGVLELVQAVSYDEATFGKDGSRRQYIEQLKTAPLGACLISVADMLENGRYFLDWYYRDPERTAAMFGGERTQRRDWFWRGRLVVIEQRLGAEHPLVQDLRAMLFVLGPIHEKIAIEYT